MQTGSESRRAEKTMPTGPPEKVVGWTLSLQWDPQRQGRGEVSPQPPWRILPERPWAALRWLRFPHGPPRGERKTSGLFLSGFPLKTLCILTLAQEMPCRSALQAHSSREASLAGHRAQDAPHPLLRGPHPVPLRQGAPDSSHKKPNGKEGKLCLPSLSQLAWRLYLPLQAS